MALRLDVNHGVNVLGVINSIKLVKVFLNIALPHSKILNLLNTNVMKYSVTCMVLGELRSTPVPISKKR